MVGLTISLAATLGYEQPAGFAIPVDETFAGLKSLRQGTEVEYGFLGISLPQPYDTRWRGKKGVPIVDVLEGTPADRFGLRKDDVITQVNGIDVHDHDALLLHVGKLRPGSRRC